jgi:hypothetical protein
MFDPASIGAALTSVKAILELLRNASDAQLAMKINWPNDERRTAAAPHPHHFPYPGGARRGARGGL